MERERKRRDEMEHERKEASRLRPIILIRTSATESALRTTSILATLAQLAALAFSCSSRTARGRMQTR